MLGDAACLRLGEVIGNLCANNNTPSGEAASLITNRQTTLNSMLRVPIGMRSAYRHAPARQDFVKAEPMVTCRAVKRG